MAASPVPTGFRRLLRALGPGLITGAADDDPSGIATYSQAGAQFGYGLAWTLLLTLPFMAAIQIISAVIGWQSRRGLTANIARHLPKSVMLTLVALLALANTINIAADLAAMADALRLVVAGPALAYAAAFGLLCLIAQVFVAYHRYAGYLKFLTLVLFVYVGAAFSVHLPFGHVVLLTLWPHLSRSRDYMLTVVAVFGTTISPYLFYWQASQEAEESRLSFSRDLASYRLSKRHAFRRIVFDTWVGMIVSNLISWFILVTTAATLHAHGIVNIQTAAQAAQALRPIAGNLTFGLFAAGIIGTGLLAVPVLAGSAAYAVAEGIRLQGSLELPASKAKGFYAIIAAATLGGLVLVALGMDPIKMLFWAAVINGVVSVPIIIATMLTATARHHKPPHKIALALPRWLVVLGWLAAVLMGFSVLGMIWQSWG